MIQQALCDSYLVEVLQGMHRRADAYKIALYTERADLSRATTTYTLDEEVLGAGYRAGGLRLEGFHAQLTGETPPVAVLDWTTDPVWPGATITARGALVYNNTRAKRAVAILDFGRDVQSSNGRFVVHLPPATSDQGLIRLAQPSEGGG
jgi:hypothetical protein